MYEIKYIPKEKTALLYQCTWLVDEDTEYEDLTITKTAKLMAPEGKFITFSVNGVGRELCPGHYVGQVKLSLSDGCYMPPHGLMSANRIARFLHTAAAVKDGKLVRQQCVPSVMQGGSVTDTQMEGVYLASTAESFNGLVISGDSEYEVKNVVMELEGFSDNDFLGVGAGVTAVDRARVTIRDSRFHLSGVTRCAIHAGGDSRVVVENCDIENISPDSDRLGFFSWNVGFLGTNRLTQLTDNASVEYRGCRMKTNGWGVCSIDGSDEGVKMLLKDTSIELSGPRAHGYGAFCIGENEVTFDHVTADVNGYPIMLMGMQGKGRANILNGSVLKGRRFGAFIVGDDNGVMTIEDSRLETGKSAICLKGSGGTVIRMKNCSVKSGNGVLLQMMDTEEAGMTSVEYLIPVGQTDSAIEGRDLTRAREGQDVFLELEDMDVTGDIYNSTTNIRAFERGAHGSPGEFHDTLVGPVHFFDAPPPDMPLPPDHRGPKNLAVAMRGTKLTGVISAAGQAYRDGLTRISGENAIELSNVRQWAQPPVNNGVCVALDPESVWVVTGESFLTALRIADGAKIEAPAGQTLIMTVNGQETPVRAGEYAGVIRLCVQ